MDFKNVPILNGLKKHIEKNVFNFHMPGHKQGKNMPKFLKENLLKMDLTEISGLDNLHYPESIIKEAQEIASKVFKSDRTYFLVNGTTVGIHAAIMSVCNPGDKILVQRNVHKSVIGGMILANGEISYINPLYNETFSIPANIDLNELKTKLEKNSSCKAVVILNPSYYGIVSNLNEISKIVHSYNKLLIVDEAHGSHFVFNENLPISAMEANADICIQSAHKTLPAITQSSYLHIKGERVNREKLEYYLSLLQTSSPSYLLMAFLDYARYYMDIEGRKKLESILKETKLLKKDFETYGGLKILDYKDYDYTRIVVNTSDLNCSGFLTASVFEKNYNIVPEMADLFNVIFITTVANDENDYKALRNALYKVRDIKNKDLKSEDLKNLSKLKYNIGYRKVMCFNEVRLRKYEYVDLKRAKGKVCYDTITPYPPGIPILNPGELIDSHVLDYMNSVLSYGGSINGFYDNYKIKVIKN